MFKLQSGLIVNVENIKLTITCCNKINKMSKRYIPQQNGIRKKAKLDITVSDHNFPLSQNTAPATGFRIIL